MSREILFQGAAKMPFCPKCRDEFQDWVKTCPDCQVALVAELPPMPASESNFRRIFARAQSSPNDLVTIATFSHPTEAYVPKSRLEAEGIPSFVADADTIDTYWLYSNAIGGAKLQVREEDAERALEILNLEVDPTDLMEEEFGKAREDEKCPKCGSLNIHYERFAKRWVFLSWFVTGLPLPFIKRKWECQDCGHTWRIDELQDINENHEG